MGHRGCKFPIPTPTLPLKGREIMYGCIFRLVSRVVERLINYNVLMI